MANKRKPHGYWNNFANVERELFDFIQKQGTLGELPTNEELIKAKRSDLSNAIRKYGGNPEVAQKLGLKLKYEAKPRGYWNNFDNVASELLALSKKQGTPGRMPTEDELRKAGLSTLANAIRKHGGVAAVAKKLGLDLTYIAKPSGYWNDFTNLKHELLDFIQVLGTPGTMPKKEELEKAGRSDLIGGMYRHGGFTSVADKLGLELVYAKKTLGYWDDFANVERELMKFVHKLGTPGIMPTNEELKKAGFSSLGFAIQKHQGYLAVAERLGLELAHNRKRLGYWEDFTNVKRELLEHIQKHGTPGVMPTYETLEKARQSSLVFAIRRKHGGYQLVAERLGLKLAYTGKPRSYWENFANVERELLDITKEYGTLGVMPTSQELKKIGQSGLVSAIHKHGGFSAVARRLTLAYTDKEYITPRTATEVEKTARAIQPLAKSNLLSGAQVMVILRRAGLLEYRNKRVVRLSASLARGNHDEIETAISQLASTSEEITTETDKIEESENLTAEEAEALVNSGLESTENPPLDKSTPEPDTQREQAVIRGLTALGELRLPLDEVLSLLTSKLLWQAFYKRLYNWYGGLDAAQNITAEDVEAAILSTYPEHTDNELVAEASARFTLEVEQAVNFAACLPNYDWHGFRLRLHQADAARRMAEVLTNQDVDQYCPNQVNLTPPMPPIPKGDPMPPLPCKDTAGEWGVRPLVGVRAMSKKIQKVELFVVWWYDTASKKLLGSTRRNSTSSTCVIPERECVHENVRRIRNVIPRQRL